eukprot:3137712-Prymnesium_polylepis.1
MLGTLSSPSLPAVESNYCATPDYALGWRFMECLGDDVVTMEEAIFTDDKGDGASEDASSRRCKGAIQYGLKLLAALRPLHERGLVHTALAPKHIARVNAGKHAEYKLLGLGSLHLEGEPYAGLLAPGVREFASPEILRNAPVDARSDLYSVAMVLFAVIAGELPPLGGVAAGPGNADPGSGFPAGYDLTMLRDVDVGTALADVLLQALNPNASMRAYADVDAMERALLDCAAATGEVFYHVYLSYSAAGTAEATLARKVYNELRRRETGQVGGGKIRVYLDQ